MHHQTIIHALFLIFAGTTVLATLALFTRQSLLVAYIIVGGILGPFGLKLIKDTWLIKQTGNIGILFLLFLLGLHLQPQNLLHSLRKMSLITFLSSAIFLVAGLICSHLFGFSWIDSLIIGTAMSFSSTIIGLKLLPTTVLHHQHTGELMISILLLQDLLAIGVLLFLQALGDRAFSFHDLGFIVSAFPILLLMAYIFEHYILAKLVTRFDQIHEYIFILSIGWCLCMAELASFMGLSEEIGAFIAGIALATNPISLYIAESLKPLRDFFLVIFFFTVGAGFDFNFFPHIILPAMTLAVLMLILKPIVFSWLLRKAGEAKALSWEVGIRLGQISEFSLLVIYLSLQTDLIEQKTSIMVQAATIITFFVSCYWVGMRYPTPLATSDTLRRD